MDTDLEILNRSPSTQKKQKQMTLLQFGSKGGFSLSCTQNRNMSPQFNKENNKPKLRSRSLSKKNDKENAENVECIIIGEKETKKPQQKKLFFTDKTGTEANYLKSGKTSPIANKKKASPKRKSVSPKLTKLKAKQDEDMDIEDEPVIDITATSVDSTEKIFVKSVEKPKIDDEASKKDESSKTDEEPKSIQKDLKNYFNFGPKFVAKLEENKNIEASKMPSKVSQTKKQTIKELLLNKGKLELEDDSELKNEAFGELISTIELYNRIIPLYTLGKFCLKKRREKKPANVKEEEEIDETLLTYESFLNMIKTGDNADNAQKTAFWNIVKNLLKILLLHDSIYDKIIVFGKKLKEFQLNELTLKAFCKIIEAYNVTDMLELDKNEYNIICNSQEMLNFSQLLTSLDKDSLNFSMNSALEKIMIVRNLCDLVLSCNEKFDEYLNEKQVDINNDRAEIAKIRQNLKPENKESTEKRLKEKEEERKDKIQEYHDTIRLNPLGSDSTNLTYWHFSCFNKLVIEQKIEESNNSRWFSINNTDIQEILKVIKMDDIKGKLLVRNLEEFMENTKDEPEPVVELETEDNSSEKGDQKKKRSALEKYAHLRTRTSLRRSCNATKILELINNGDSSDLSSDDSEPEDPKIIPEAKIDVKEEWLTNYKRIILSTETLTAENLLLYLINFESYRYFYGIYVQDEKYELFKKLVNEYQKFESAAEKFEKLKEIVDFTTSSIFTNYNLTTMLNKEKKDHIRRVIMETTSLSTLTFIITAQFYMTNWKYLCRGPCETCKKRGPHFEIIESLEQMNEYWKNEKESNLGYLTCKNCDYYSKTRYMHRSCFSQDKDYFNIVEKKRSRHRIYAHKCEACFKKSGYYVIEEIVENADNESACHETRRVKKIVNYSEKMDEYKISDYKRNTTIKKSKKPKRTKTESNPERKSDRVRNEPVKKSVYKEDSEEKSSESEEESSESEEESGSEYEQEPKYKMRKRPSIERRASMRSRTS